MYQACWPQRCRDLPHEPSVFSLSQGMRQKEERRGEKKTENHSFYALVICGSQCLRLKPQGTTLRNWSALSTHWHLKREQAHRAAGKHLKAYTLPVAFFFCSLSSGLLLLTGVKHVGMFRWISTSALEGTVSLPFSGSQSQKLRFTELQQAKVSSVQTLWQFAW